MGQIWIYIQWQIDVVNVIFLQENLRICREPNLIEWLIDMGDVIFCKNVRSFKEPNLYSSGLTNKLG